MQKFCMLKKLDAEILHDLIFPLNLQLFLQQLYDTEILHGLKKLDAEILHDLIFRLILQLFLQQLYDAEILHVEKVGCRNSARP